jgi:quercetin dioxygenase-like cupin family protein
MKNHIKNNPIGEKNKIQIVSREEIPAIYTVEHEGKIHNLGELRDFQWHSILKDFMPPTSELSISWVQLKESEILQPHVHPIQSMMIFYQGNGKMLGQMPQNVSAGDIVVVPPGCEHGFVGGPQGLYALSIQFGEGLYTKSDMSRVSFSEEQFTLEQLMAYNQECLQQFLQKPFFAMLQDSTLEDPEKLQTFLNAMQIWVDGNQTLLFTRQATVKEEIYQKVFLEHMFEEIGHEKLHADNVVSEDKNTKKITIHDPILEAITNWFPYQMLILDNIEKAAIIHLVIENASVCYHTIAKPHLAKYINTEYFDVHITADSEHAALGEMLLQNQNSRTYIRLREIINQAWEMLGAMTDRVVYLTYHTRKQSSKTSKNSESEQQEFASS